MGILTYKTLFFVIYGIFPSYVGNNRPNLAVITNPLLYGSIKFYGIDPKCNTQIPIGDFRRRCYMTDLNWERYVEEVSNPVCIASLVTSLTVFTYFNRARGLGTLFTLFP